MPIGTALANNLKINNIVNSTIGTEGGNGPPGSHHREMSLDDDRGNRRTNVGTAANGTNNQKAEIIASRIVNQSKSPDRYVIGNNLVVNLGSPGTGADNNSTSS
jgi:hypothetical protein